jgi:putative membrane protein
MLLLYQIFNAAPSCISSFMVISLFKFRRPSLSKGLLAGAIGGLAGGLAKAAAEVIYPPRVEGQISPPVILVERVLERVGGRPLSPHQQKLAESSVHFAFSAAVGALYGALAEYRPDATRGQGAAFALVLLAATHESALPALDLAEPPHRQPKQEQLSELLTHLVFGLTTEQLRRRVRRWM